MAIGKKISGRISYMESKYPPRDGGLYLLEHESGNWIFPTGLIEPEDLEKMAEHLRNTRNDFLRKS
jgi:hypothetical protein